LDLQFGNGQSTLSAHVLFGRQSAWLQPDLTDASGPIEAQLGTFFIFDKWGGWSHCYLRPSGVFTLARSGIRCVIACCGIMDTVAASVCAVSIGPDARTFLLRDRAHRAPEPAMYQIKPAGPTETHLGILFGFEMLWLLLLDIVRLAWGFCTCAKQTPMQAPSLRIIECASPFQSGLVGSTCFLVTVRHFFAFFYNCAKQAGMRAGPLQDPKRCPTGSAVRRSTLPCASFFGAKERVVAQNRV